MSSMIWRYFCGSIMHGFFVTAISAVVLHVIGAGSVSTPNTNCYAISNTSHIYDFSNFMGQHFEYDDDKDPDLAIRFCKDVETRSGQGYVDFGRFDMFNSFVSSSGQVNFTQEYYGGDLVNCEKSFDKLGRTAQVNIICGNCPNGHCTGGLGCICNVTYESACRVLVDLAIPCVKPGQRVFEGFTVGFHPRSWEIVYNGMTQLGYEKPYGDYRFKTEQRHVALYMTAIASLSDLVQKPTVKISPEQGLEIQLSGSGAKGIPPTTLSPTILLLDWRCEKARDLPYEVEITIPIENYDPIQFIFAKMCEHQQNEAGEATRGWTIFGILSCIFIVASTLFCCGGFIYRVRVHNLHGLDALPGKSMLSACLETVDGSGGGYIRANDFRNPAVNEPTWEEQQNQWRTSDRTYGSI